METGYIKLWRSFEKWEWFSCDNMAKFFIWLLLRATHKDVRFRGLEIKRGQMIFGRNEAIKATGLSAQSIRSCIKRLKSTSEITIKSTNKFSVITIVNYDTYQNQDSASNQQSNQPSNQQVTNNQPTSNHIQEYKNIRNKENTYKEPTRFSPPSLEEVVSFFSTMGRTDGAVFFDHFTSNGWKVGGKTPMKDWHAAARNWDRRSPVKKGYDIWQTKHVQIPK